MKPQLVIAALIALTIPALAKSNVIPVKVTVVGADSKQQDMGTVTNCKSTLAGNDVNTGCRSVEQSIQFDYTEITISGGWPAYSDLVHYKLYIRPGYLERVTLNNQLQRSGYAEAGTVLMPGTYDALADRGTLTITYFGRKVKGKIVGAVPDTATTSTQRDK